MSFYFSKNIPLIEKIKTWQGEGPNAGKQMLLVRYKRCNRHCPFCDTWNKMSDIQEQFYSLSDIDFDLKDIGNIMITGGEPLMHYNTNGVDILDNYESTISILDNTKFEYGDIETNGSQNLLQFIHDCRDIVYKTQLLDSSRPKNINISWSPKFTSEKDIQSHIDTCMSINNYYADPDVDKINKVVIYPVIKLVIADDLAKEFLYKVINKKYYDRNKIYLMPLGCTYEEIQASFPEVVSLAKKFGCHISSRLHLVHNFE